MQSNKIFLMLLPLVITGCNLWGFLKPKSAEENFKKFVWLPDDVKIDSNAFSSNVDFTKLGFSLPASTLSAQEVVRILKQEAGPVFKDIHNQFPAMSCAKDEKGNAGTADHIMAYAPLDRVNDLAPDKFGGFLEKFEKKEKVKLGVNGFAKVALDLSPSIHSSELFGIGGNTDVVYGVRVLVMEANPNDKKQSVLTSNGSGAVVVFTYERKSKILKFVFIDETSKGVIDTSSVTKNGGRQSYEVHIKQSATYDGSQKSLTTSHLNVGKDEEGKVVKMNTDAAFAFQNGKVALKLNETVSALDKQPTPVSDNYVLGKSEFFGMSISCLKKI